MLTSSLMEIDTFSLAMKRLWRTTKTILCISGRTSPKQQRSMWTKHSIEWKQHSFQPLSFWRDWIKSFSNVIPVKGIELFLDFFLLADWYEFINYFLLSTETVSWNGKTFHKFWKMQVKSYYPMFSEDKVFFLIVGQISFYVSRQAYEQIKQRGDRCYSALVATRS